MKNLTIWDMEITPKYFNVGIQHLLFQPGSEEIAILNENLKTRHKIHIFLTSWNEDIQLNLIACMDCAAATMSKVFIHIPKICRDLQKIIIKSIETISDKISYKYKYGYKILIDGNNATNICTGSKLYTGLARAGITLSTEATVSINTNNYKLDAVLNMNTYTEQKYNGHWEINLAHLDISKLDFNLEGVFSSKYRKDDPELFKDLIIKDFKQNTPKGIIKSFKNDDDIWDYIMEENEWERTVTMKSVDGIEYNGSFDDQMKQIVGEIINEKETQDNA